MDFKDCKIGQRIVGNSLSSRYSKTTSSMNFVGEIISCNPEEDSIQVEVLKHDEISEIGRKFWVDPECFDLEQEEAPKGVVIEKCSSSKVDKSAIQYGDMLELVNGEFVMVMPDRGGDCYRFFTFGKNTLSDWYSTLSGLFRNLPAEVVNHIPAEKITIKLNV